jgi:hypothetical protein
LRAPDGTLRTKRQAFPAGDPLEAYLPEGEALARVSVNGGVILPEHYSTFVPRADDEIWLWPAWGYVPTLTEALIYAGVSLVVGLAVSAASHFLFRPKPLLLPQQQKMTEAPERTFSFEGIRTAIGPGASVPVIYGRHRIGGQLLLAAVDHATVSVEDGSVRPAVAIADITYGPPSAIVTIYAPGHGFHSQQTVILDGITGKTSLNTTWTIDVIDADSFTLLASWAVDFGLPWTGGGYATLYTWSSKTYQAITNPPTLTLLLALCEGPIDAILTDTIQINGQPIGNFPGVQVFTGLGTANQPALGEFGEARNTFSDGRAISAGGLTYTSNAPLSAFVLNLVWQQGLFYVNPKGDKENNYTTLQYRYAPAGTGAWSAWSTFQVSADRTATVRLGVKREGLPLARYDIQIAFVTAAQTDELHAKFEATLESVTEFIPNTYAYPYTALMGLRALATDALQGALPNITVEVRGRTVRVGTLAPVETWSDNPAWCVLDALTNARYGRSVVDGEIDLTAFALYAAYCDQTIDGEPRHRLNYVLDHETRTQTFFLEVMGASRTLLLKSAGLWTPRPTRVETPTCVLSWAMVTNVTITYLRDVDAINVMEARFTNEAHDYEQDVLTWPTLANWPAEVHKQSLDLRGVTKPSRVMRALQFELNRRRYENVVLEMDCSTEALPLQMHDLFRFAHPLPGWGVSGRLQGGSTNATLRLDEACTIEPDVAYIVYVRHEDDTVEVRHVIPVVYGTVYSLTLATVLSQTPVPRTSLWVFGRLDADANMRTFRVTDLKRRSDTTVHLEAVIHNPSIYDDPVATPLEVSTTLFNPLGPPPPLTTLIATEMTRIQSSGASLRVVNLSWDVAALGAGVAPYGGATILRRTILAAGQLGQSTAGVIDLGAVIDPNDPNINYTVLAQVRGHILDFDDYTVLSGGTYQYRVIPISPQGVPNNGGGREVLIHVAGPTTPGYFPGTPTNLRLRGQPVGATTWEGRDVHLEWDRVAESPLFSETFFVQEYVLQIWAPAQLYLLRTMVVATTPLGQSIQFTYTHQQNEEDQIRAGYVGARRDLLILVWARTNTGLQSLEPASLTVHNLPPDMSTIIPDTTALFEAALINFNQWAEPRDFDHYEVHLDTVNPPVAIYQDVSIRFRKLFPAGLIANTTYYTYILPYDTFGPGIPSQTASFMPVALTADKLDTVPPGVPTGLALTTGADIGPDGTSLTWVEASWNANPESDVAGYQLSFRVTGSSSTAPTVVFPGRTDTRYKLMLPGNLTVFAKIAAFDKIQNISAFTAEVSITSGADTTPPGSPANLTAIGGVQKMHLLWTPPSDLDYDYSEVWSAAVNNRASAVIVAHGNFQAEQQGLAANDTRYYWLRARDTSGNAGPYFPLSATAGIAGTAGQLDTTFISSLAANKIIAGTITALVKLGVADRIELDGLNQYIAIRDAATSNLRVLLGRLGPLSTDWGVRIFNAIGQVMFDATDGGTTAVGIKVGVINSSHLRTDTLVVTTAAQIANALIGDAHITNLSAAKISAGTINAQIGIGVGDYVQLDGINRLIQIFDEALTSRVQLGRVGGGATDYGLRVFSPTGALMWDLTSGVVPAGITPSAVTPPAIATAAVETIKVATNAISESLAYASSSTLTITTTETEAASVTFASLDAGDQVWLVATATGHVLAGDIMNLRIRENTTSGTELAFAAVVGGAGWDAPVVLQAVYTVGSALTSKKFVFSFLRTGGTNQVALDAIKFTGLRRRR